MLLNLTETLCKEHTTRKDVFDALKKIYPDRDIEKPQQYLDITDIHIRKYTSLDNDIFVYRDDSENVIQMFPNLNIVLNLRMVVSVGDYCFYNCTKLHNSNEMYFCLNIGKYAFYKTNVKFKHVVGYHAVGEHSFEGCTGLTDIRADILAPYMFANSSVKKAIIYNVEYMPEYDHCFDGCQVEISYG